MDGLHNLSKENDFGKISEKEKTWCDEEFRMIVNIMRKRFVPDIALLWRSYIFAYNKHNGQRRRDGEPYITHPLAVAKILANVGFESDLVSAALLHDVIEDCKVTYEELEQAFGSSIATVVDSVSQLKADNANDREIQKEDLDSLSDVKFLIETTEKNNRKAFYIKLADRIHNLSTIGSFPEEKKQAKVLHTRNILLPVARSLHIYKLVDILETLCLEIENPSIHQTISNGYHRILLENAYTIRGKDGFKEFFRELITDSELEIRKNIVSLEFNERYTDSIYRNLLPYIKNIKEIDKYITKEYIPLYNIYFVVNDNCVYTPEKIFFYYYKALHESKWKITVTGIGHAMGSGELFYFIKDRFGNQYRLFIQTENELLRFYHGVSITGSENDVRCHIMYINYSEPDEPQHKMIPVYRKNGKLEMIEEGATVLDFAFRINTSMGICCTYAIINDRKAKMPIHTRLRPGDVVEIRSDHNKEKPWEDIPHASIRWFEYLHTREAIHALSRRLQTRMEVAAPTIAVYSTMKDKKFDIPSGATLLDYVILYNSDKAFSGFKCFLNKSHQPADMIKILRYNDRITIVWEEGANMPKLEWFCMLQTAEARKILLQYFLKERRLLYEQN